MGYYCRYVKTKEDKSSCKNENNNFNQCCQDCEYIKDCERKCSYANCTSCSMREYDFYN